MRIHYLAFSKIHREYKEISESVVGFTKKQILFNGNEKERLEEQPERLAICIGNLLEFLLKKKLMTKEEFLEALTIDYFSRWEPENCRIEED